MSGLTDIIDARIARALGRQRLPYRGVIGLVNSQAPVGAVSGTGLADEPINGAELMQHYGLSTNPPRGTMFVALPVGGKTAHSIIVGTEHASYRIKGLATGEVAIYTDEGDSIVLKRGHLIEVTTKTWRVNAETIELNAKTITGNASAGVNFNTPMMAASQDIKASGEVYDHGNKSMSGMRFTYQGHTHIENNVAGGPCQPPTQEM